MTLILAVRRKNILVVRKFHENDAKEVSDLIIKTLRTNNIKDYSKEYIENDVAKFTPKDVIERGKSYGIMGCI